MFTAATLCNMDIDLIHFALPSGSSSRRYEITIIENTPQLTNQAKIMYISSKKYLKTLHTVATTC